MQEIILEL